jgi:protoporphyrinogen IX oxidase
MVSFYLWLKALHIISFTAWMAGMFYLPRLYVYHASIPLNSKRAQMLKLMELRLLRFIMNPAMVATLIFGLLLAKINGDILMQSGWFHVKLTFVFLLFGFHGFLAKTRKEFANNRNNHSEKFFRIVNELPTLCLFVIVIMAVIKPI